MNIKKTLRKLSHLKHGLSYTFSRFYFRYFQFLTERVLRVQVIAYTMCTFLVMTYLYICNILKITFHRKNGASRTPVQHFTEHLTCTVFCFQT